MLTMKKYIALLVISLPTLVFAEDLIETIRNTPCLYQYRAAQLFNPEAEFTVPEGFTASECANAKAVNIRLEDVEFPGRRQDREKKLKAVRDALQQSLRPGVRIGMSSSDVVNKSSWGKPERVNRTTTARGTTEQWIYGDAYLYFTNGRLTTIQD